MKTFIIRKPPMYIHIALILILVYLIYKFIVPQILYNDIGENYKDISINYDNMHQNFKLQSFYAERLQELLDEVNKLGLLTDINQEHIIETLKINMKEYDIEAVNINFSEAVPLKIENPIEDEYITNDNSSEEFDEVYNYESMVLTMPVNIKFNSSTENMLLFIDSLQNNSFDISVTNIQSIPYEPDMVYADMDLIFYAFPLTEISR